MCHVFLRDQNVSSEKLDTVFDFHFYILMSLHNMWL